MAVNDEPIAQNFVEGRSVEESRRLFRSSQMSYDNSFLYSYAMPLAHRREYGGSRFILVNGDGSPTKTTSKHQRALFSCLRETTWDDEDVRHTNILVPHAFIPFSVLRQANMEPRYVEVLHYTPDREAKRTVMVRNKDTGKMEPHERTVHFLGETLFTHPHRKGEFFVCGLDRNDDPNKRMFYMARVPGKKAPATVDEALLRLRPKGLPDDAKRQGEWFFVPEPAYKPAKNVFRAANVPIVSADAKAQVGEMVKVAVKRGDKEVEAWTVRSRERRHVASTLLLNGAVYAKGVVRDEEHSPLKLGETWHRVVKNLAVEGWRYVPGPNGGAGVD